MKIIDHEDFAPATEKHREILRAMFPSLDPNAFSGIERIEKDAEKLIMGRDDKMPRKRPTPLEAAEQERLFQWAAWMGGQHPELALLFHIPNGGSRNKIEAANLKRQGVKAGVSDLMLPVARGRFYGLFIEMKAGKNKATEKQLAFLDAVQKQGYAAIICYSAEEAAEALLKYLTMKGGAGK